MKTRFLNQMVCGAFSIALFSFSLSALAGTASGMRFPDGPDAVMTPGVLCTKPTKFRYQERIPYCDRDVSSGTKNQVIAAYDNNLGYDVRRLPRGDFKIDHFVPLSIGGANDAGNLWPQHKTIYAYSDEMEGDLCTLMTAGKIKQAEAIRVIKECKLNLGRCKELSDYLKGLIKSS